ncbi:MAG: histidinol dehydrogenase [Hyphomicrobiales bacterium]|nr:MAG: histidinol dehydrogenase [Hyphomicrobiales bacterium]
MVYRLDMSADGFEREFTAFLGTKRESSADVNAAVAAILSDVRAHGDRAVRDYTKRFDRLELPKGRMALSGEAIAEAAASCEAETLEALRLAYRRIKSYHERQRPEDARFTDEVGVELGHRWTPVQAVGLYVPGGAASYPSSVLMNAIPALVAGVERIAMVVPSPDGALNPLVLAAAELCGITEIYPIGGAQAVAALSYGTETIAPVDKIVGPGNAYVAAAKRQVLGTVGIDMIAGPSEILVLADRDNDPAWIAADLLSQAEHDEVAQSVLITDDGDFAGQVEAEIEAQLATLPRGATAQKSWQDYGAVIMVPSLTAALPLVDRIAPEHLEIATADPEALMAGIRNAGAIFLGRMTPEAVGDYVGGSNHVLPTSRSARYSSVLNVLDFMKRTSILKCSEAALRAIGPAAVTLAEAEGLDAHARSVAVRLNARRVS